MEIIVAADGCTDGTEDALHRLDSSLAVKVVRLDENGGPAVGRNRALKEATGDVLLFLDDDVVPGPGLIARHLAAHDADPCTVAIGPMLPPAQGHLSSWLMWEAVTLAKQYDAMQRGEYVPTPRQFYTANASVRRVHAEAAGGFDPAFKRAEDVEFAYRLADRGLSFRFLPDAAVVHEPSRSWEAWLRVAHEYGRHAVIFERDHGRDQLQLAYREWHSRHALNRITAMNCVGHPGRSAIVKGLGGLVAQHGAGRPWLRFQLGVCSLIYSVGFWQGVADETGLGSQVWSAAGQHAA